MGMPLLTLVVLPSRLEVSFRNLSSCFCSSGLSGWILQSIGCVLGTGLIMWSHGFHGGSSSNDSLLKTFCMKSWYCSSMISWGFFFLPVFTQLQCLVLLPCSFGHGSKLL